MKRLIIGIFLMPTFATAGLFGPSTFDDCVLEGLKTAKTDFAVRALYSTCGSKFPSKESNAPAPKVVNPEEAKRTALIKKCGISEQGDKKIHGFMVDIFPAVADAVSKLKSQKLSRGTGYNRGTTYISFQNNNSFPISGVMIGFGLNKELKNCSWKANDYKATFICNYSRNTDGVSATTYGSIPCPQDIDHFYKDNYCIIGIVPAFDPQTQGLASAMDRMGLCN